MSVEFVETIKTLLSPDNNLRNAAEKRYNEAKRDQPAFTVSGLFQVITQETLEQPLREQGAVLLRQCLSKVSAESSLWQQLGEPGQAEVKAKLLQILEAEQLPRVRRKVADCVQSLGNELISLLSNERPANAKEWPELMPMLMRCICDTAKDANARADCLWVIQEMAVSVWQILLAGAERSYQVFQACLADSAESVRATTAACLCSFMDQVESREDRKPFTNLIPDVCNVMSQLATSGDSKHLTTMLQSLQTSTEIVDFFKNHVTSHIMPILSSIAKSHSEEDARKSAFEVILSFLESKPKTILKTQGFSEQIIEICVRFLMELSDDLEEWAQDTEEGEETEDQFVFGKEAVDRICKCAQKVDLITPVLEMFKQAVHKLLQTNGWKEGVAALTILHQCAEYVDEEATVEQMVQAILLHTHAGNARLRFAAWTAVAQFAVDHSDTITSDESAKKILPRFLEAIDDSVARVSLRSMEAFQHYGEKVEREDLEPFVHPFMGKLGVRLQGNLAFQKKSITFIAVIVGQVDDAFGPYYGELMPFLKQMVQNLLHNVEERALLGKCFECISLMAKAVGREGFRADAEVIMQAMIQATSVPNLPHSDPVKEYMMAAAERICGTMKEDFKPFIPHILPQILEKLALEPKEFNADTAKDDFEEGGELNLTMTQENGKVKVMVMYSSEMQELQGALECIFKFVEELGKAYGEFVAPTAQALLPVFEFPMAEEIRDLAFEVWSQLCDSARQGGQVQVLSNLVLEFLKRIIPKLESDEVDVQAYKTRADGITACLKKAGPGVLSAEQVAHLSKTSLARIGESLRRRGENAEEKRKQREQDDEVDSDGGDEEEALRLACAEIAGALMQHHADLFINNGLTEYLALAQRLLQPDVGDDDKKLALSVLCDLLDHLNSRITGQWNQFMPQLLQGILHPNPELRQPCCYGASLAAKVPEFAPFALETAQQLLEVIPQLRARAKKKSERANQACADNALSALVQILLTHPAAVQPVQDKCWAVWLAGLPCQEDDQEGERNHRILLRLVEQEKPEVCGEAGQNVPRILTVLVDVYKTDMVDEDTSLGIGKLVLRLGEARLEQFATNFTEKQKTRLLRIVREAQKAPAV